MSDAEKNSHVQTDLANTNEKVEVSKDEQLGFATAPKKPDPPIKGDPIVSDKPKPTPTPKPKDLENFVRGRDGGLINEGNG